MPPSKPPPPSGAGPLVKRPALKRRRRPSPPPERKNWWFDPEATMVTQLDSDGLPMGLSSGRTRLALSPYFGHTLRFVC